MINTIITRMRRKIDIVRLDAKARQDVLYHDMNELLSLLDMLERELDAELAKALWVPMEAFAARTAAERETHCRAIRARYKESRQ